MIEVIGFEGHWPDDAIVAWGAAAVRDEARVWNSVSGAGIARADFPGGVEETYTPFDAVSIREDYRSSPLLVVALRSTAEGSDFFKPDTGKLGGYLAKKQQKGCVYYVLKDRDSFGLYVTEVLNTILMHVLRGAAQPDNKRLRLLSTALALAPENPLLHSLRVVFADQKGRAKLIAEKSLRTPESRSIYSWMLRACAPESSEYGLKYKDGIAAGGGLDTDRMVTQFSALNSVHRKLKPVIVKRLPFLDSENDIPAPRVKALQAASADISFVSRVEGEPLLHRVVRYYEMRMLQELMQGRVPGELESDQEFFDAMETLVRPSQDTSVYHRPFDSEDSEPVVFQGFVHRDAKADEPFVALGFVQGASRGVKFAELRLFPRMREVVSVDSNGRGGVPSGARVFSERNDYLFRPAIFRVQRFVDERKRHKFFLDCVEIIEGYHGDLLVNAVPSSVVDGAFLLDREIRVTVEAQTICLNGQPLGSVKGPYSLEQATAWMNSYALWAQEQEIAAALQSSSRWLYASRHRPASALARIVLTLEQLGGESLLTDLVAAVSTRYNVSARQNNTRREIRENLTYVRYSPDDEDKVTLTDSGRQYSLAFRRAGGQLMGDSEVG